MAEEIDAGPFTIVSYTEGNPPIGINFTRTTSQVVYVDAPVHLTSQWTARRVDETTYSFSIGQYHYVGVQDGKIIASIYQEVEKLWKITRQSSQNAFTIELADQPGYGWTIEPEAGRRKLIVIGTLNVLLSEPPQFDPGQLFLLKNDE